MEATYSLLHSLTNSEWNTFRNYLTCFTTYNPEDVKQLNLAQILIHARQEPKSEECCLKLYGTKKDQGFKMLKSRLKEKLLDFLITDISADKKLELDEADLNVIKIKKNSFAVDSVSIYRGGRFDVVFCPS